ncbi:hypothetical protein KP509_04G050700 [Ceratopteris richardii]|uniref:Uncharacterized protein n=1 Tax=Ceratopteris richardii TaxID=49495 RepID=A0A8T2UWV7_CERRI|nr:hypothetical protein KP509_04G050700 [Ceratopteris richardii]
MFFTNFLWKVQLLIVTALLFATLTGALMLLEKPTMIEAFKYDLPNSIRDIYISKSKFKNVQAYNPQIVNHRRLLVDLEATMRMGEGCTIADVTILQGQANPLPDGIPIFTVQIFNSCTSPRQTCGLSHIHVACGWWATAKLVNPNVFRRLAFNDCLVNNGRPLRPGQLLTFQYANSFQYPMSVKSVSNSCT